MYVWQQYALHTRYCYFAKGTKDSITTPARVRNSTVASPEPILTTMSMVTQSVTKSYRSHNIISTLHSYTVSN